MRAHSSIRHYLVYIPIAIFTAFSLAPLAWMIDTSLKTLPEAMTSPPSWSASQFTLDSYLDVILEKESMLGSAAPLPFKQLFMNSLTYSISSTLIALLLSVFAAYALSKIIFPGKKYFLLIILFGQLLPAAAKAVPIYNFISSLRLIDNPLSLILLYIQGSTPFAIWILHGVFEAIPSELEDAARIDGCSKTRALFSIYLPLCRHGLLAAALYAFLGAWNEFFFANLFIHTASKKTLSAGLTYYIQDVGVDWVKLMAAANLATIPALIIFVFIRKYFVRGLMAGIGKA